MSNKDLIERIEHTSEKVFTDIVRKKNIFTNDILAALTVVANFLKVNSHVIVGGQAIDFALRLRGTNIYDDDAIPDYDILSPNFHTDAYLLANQLIKHGLQGISVINALHPSTMKVRVNFTTVCDITYIPPNLYKILPTLNYSGFRIIHPSYQYIDQHRSLSHPYEGAPFITILHRLEKDMKRYDLLYSKYPFTTGEHKHAPIPEGKHAQSEKIKDNGLGANNNLALFDIEQYSFSSEILDNCCLNGYVALMYWFHKAKNINFTSALGIPKQLLECTFSEKNITCAVPSHLYGITISTDIIFEIIENIQKNFPTMQFNHKYKNPILDKVKRKVLMKYVPNDSKPDADSSQKYTSKWEIFDTKGLMIAAYKPWSEINLWIGNIQLIMLYAMTYYWIFSCKKKYIKHTLDKAPSNISRINTARAKAELYKLMYLLCRELVAWAAKGYINDTSRRDEYKLFLPTEETYGLYNWSDRYKISRQRFKIALQEAEEPTFKLLPRAAYPADNILIDLDNPAYSFDIAQSEIFELDGKTVKQFQPIILPE